MVSSFTVSMISLNMLLGVVIPIGLLIYIKKHYKVSAKSFITGAFIMVIFALVLESLFHQIILGSPIGSRIQSKGWLYAIYGGLMAGAFEETGRLVAMKFLMKKQQDNPRNALMYGAGHGGIETFLILTVGMINYMLYAVVINSGQQETLLAPLDAANRAVLQEAFDSLIAVSGWSMLLAPMERISALIAQMALSVIVWIAVTGVNKGVGLFLLAVLLHFLLDAGSVILMQIGLPVIGVEIAVLLLALGIAWLARILWKREYGR